MVVQSTEQARNERALLLLSLLAVCSAPDAPLTTSRVAGQRLHSPGDQMMLAVRAATAATASGSLQGDLRHCSSSADVARTRYHGHALCVALKCSLGDKRFIGATCSWAQRPVAYTVLRQLSNATGGTFRDDATTTRGITRRLPCLTFHATISLPPRADAMDAALRRDCGAGVSLFDAPFTLLVHERYECARHALRNPRDWALSRIASFPRL